MRHKNNFSFPLDDAKALRHDGVDMKPKSSEIQFEVTATDAVLRRGTRGRCEDVGQGVYRITEANGVQPIGALFLVKAKARNDFERVCFCGRIADTSMSTCRRHHSSPSFS